MPFESTNYLALSAMITPAVLLMANGSLLISTSNRMARVVDRVRTLNEKGDELGRGAAKLDFQVERRAHVVDQLLRLEWRRARVRFAVTALYLSFACFVGTSLVLALNALLGDRFVAVPTALSIAGVSLMLSAAINLFREVRAALASSREEIRFYRDCSGIAKPTWAPLVSDTSRQQSPGHGTR